MTRIGFRFSLVFGLLLSLAVVACGVQGNVPPSSDSRIQLDSVPPLPARFRIVAIDLAGVSDGNSQVEVNGLADQDGTTGTSWHVSFGLDGKEDKGSLPLDPGEATSFSLRAVAKSLSGGSDRHLRVRLSFLDPMSNKK